ncbi:glycoside hydrolase family 88 protein [Neobacillus vireti]|uniref:glycoside hydrolase family 88 protein n=1 Tax=Neobacillus vireti TaxID=220686 RepID=UPI002FFD6AD3
MIIQSMLIIIVLIVLIIFFIDVVPTFIDWLSRIHIGKYNNLSNWNKSITKKGACWLKNTPKIKVTDNTRLIVIDRLRGNYYRNSIQHWQEGSLLLGLSEYLNYYDDEKIKKEILDFLNIKFSSNGDWKKRPKHIDSALLSYAVMKLNFINKDKYKKAFDYTWELIKNHIGKDGTVEYRKSMKSYRYVDTVGFICPFLIAYGVQYKKDECIELAIKQIKEYEQNGMLDKYYIPSHTYELEKKLPVGLVGWGRGLGWFAIGLIDSWCELSNFPKYKIVLEESVIRFAKAALEFQEESGNWNWTVTRKESRPDSSATATLAWFMLNASRIKEISKESLVSTEKAINYLMKVTRKSGAVDFSQGDTKDIGVYSILFNILPFTQGFCIRVINQFEGSKM